MTFKWDFWNRKKKTTENKDYKMELDTSKNTEDLLEDFKLLEFQWIKGENAGGVEYFSHMVEEGSIEFLVFKSGLRLNKKLLNEFVETFPISPVNLGETPSDIPKINSKSEVNSINYTKNSPLGVKVNKASPIYGLLSKQKPNMVDVDISIKINLPPKELYSVLTNSFDGAREEIVDYVISSLNIDDIKKSLSDSILNTYYEDIKNTSENE